MRSPLPLFTCLLAIALSYPGYGQYTSNPAKNSNKSHLKGTSDYAGPKSITRNLTQDRNGNIWIAAFDGIFRYDGKVFTNVTRDVSSARFFSVLEDSKGNFWFGTIGSGVYYYDGKSFRNFTTREGLVDNRVPCIYEDKSGNIWFATQEGVSRYDGKSFQNYTLDGKTIENNESGKHSPKLTSKELPNDHNDVNSIIEDKTGKLWFGTRGNSGYYDGTTFTVAAHNGRPFKNVRSIIEDKKGNIWMGGADGLWRYDGAVYTQLSPNFVGYIYEDKKGNIWTSSQGADGTWVVSRYYEKSLSSRDPVVFQLRSKYEENKGMTFGILETSDENIWFGALDGVYRYDGKTVTDFKSETGRD